MGLVDLLTGQLLLDILDKETKRLAVKQLSATLTSGDIQTLERLAKTYHILKTEDRDSEKGLGKLSDSELEQLSEDSESGSDTTD